MAVGVNPKIWFDVFHSGISFIILHGHFQRAAFRNVDMVDIEPVESFDHGAVVPSVDSLFPGWRGLVMELYDQLLRFPRLDFYSWGRACSGPGLTGKGDGGGKDRRGNEPACYPDI